MNSRYPLGQRHGSPKGLSSEKSAVLCILAFPSITVRSSVERIRQPYAICSSNLEAMKYLIERSVLDVSRQLRDPYLFNGTL